MIFRVDIFFNFWYSNENSECILLHSGLKVSATRRKRREVDTHIYIAPVAELWKNGHTTHGCTQQTVWPSGPMPWWFLQPAQVKEFSSLKDHLLPAVLETNSSCGTHSLLPALSWGPSISKSTMHVLRPLKYQGREVNAVYPVGRPTAGQFMVKKPKTR